MTLFGSVATGTINNRASELPPREQVCYLLHYVDDRRGWNLAPTRRQIASYLKERGFSVSTLYRALKEGVLQQAQTPSGDPTYVLTPKGAEIERSHAYLLNAVWAF